MAISDKIPSLAIPVVDKNKNINPVWWRFFRDFTNEIIESSAFPDMVAIEALSGTGISTRTGTNAWSLRTITAGSSKISISNGDGVSGNPAVDVTEANLTLSNMGGTLGVIKGGTGLSTTTQGDLLYSSSNNVLSSLAKDVNSTRYLSNQGSSNSPSWNQVNLSNGVTSTLPIANGGTAVTVIPKFRAYAGANQAISTGTATKVQLNTELFDTNSNFDSTTNYRFTPTVAGKYQINVGLTMQFDVGDIATDWAIYIYKNGVGYSQIEQRNVIASAITGLSISDIVDCNGSSDYIELYVYQAAGANRDVLGSSNVTWMSGSLLV